MPERLTDAEVAAVRERWEADQAIWDRGISRSYTMTKNEAADWEPHHELGRLLATLEASEARVRALQEERRKFHMVGGWLYAALLMVSAQFGVHQEPKNAEPLAAWRALTRGEAGTDGE